MARGSVSPFESMRWFMGVVEDTHDPLKVNRVRVRCIEYHTDNRANLPTESLPWASFMHTGAHMSAPNVVPGDWVVGFFLDGDQAQQPIIMGMLDGIPGPADPSKGFNDPTGQHPKQPGSPTNSPLARGDPAKQDAILKAPPLTTPTASGATVQAPNLGYAPVYPNNHVIETDGGNIIELDDTAGAERIDIFHASGSFMSLNPDGSATIQILGDTFQIAGGQITIASNKAVNVVAYGEIGLLSAKDVTIAGKSITMVSQSDITVTAPGSINASAGSALNLGGESVSVDGGSLFAADAGQVAISSGMSVVPEKAPPAPQLNSG